MFDALTRTIRDTLLREFGVEAAEVKWEVPQDSAHGDIATPVALQTAKLAKTSPGTVAQSVVRSLLQERLVDRAETAGPGYVNIWLKTDALLNAVAHADAACEPAPVRKDEAPIIIEYSSPNIAKPFGIHHILTTVIGQVLVNAERHLGSHCIAINHTGDWGTQFGKVATAFERWGEKPLEECAVDDLLALYVRFHKEAEVDSGLEDAAREKFKQLEDGDEKVRAFWKTAVDITMRELQRTYDDLGVSFDHVMGESFYEDKMAAVIEEGKKKGVFTPGEKGALICDFGEESLLPPAIVLKGDGATIYHTRDLATIRYRLDAWHPKKVLYVVGAEQQLYFQQLFAMVKKLGWDLPLLEHVSFGRMRFAHGGMSTRRGEVLKLQDVLDESVQKAKEVIERHGDSIQTDDSDALAVMMGRGSVVYGILSQNRKMDMLFDWEKVLSFDGNSAPYMQYTHARARSVLRKAEVGDLRPENVPTPETLAPAERALMNRLRQFPSALEEMRSAHMPHVLTGYLFMLCQDFNAFYNNEPILKAEGRSRDFRLHLTAVSARILKTGASILTIRVPDRM